MIDPFAWLAGWIHETCLIPALWHMGWMQWEDVSFMWVLFAVYGVLQVVINCAGEEKRTAEADGRENQDWYVRPSQP